MRNSKLQKTYLRVVRLVKNLCAYEGALYRRVRASGRVCPLCSRWCEEVEHRYYQCPKCGITFDRDYGGAFNTALEALPPPLADELRKWLKAHPKALARNYGNKPSRGEGSRRAQLRRAPLPGTPAGRASPLGGRSWGAARATRGQDPARRRSGDGRRGAGEQAAAEAAGPHEPPRSSARRPEGGPGGLSR